MFLSIFKFERYFRYLRLRNVQFCVSLLNEGNKGFDNGLGLRKVINNCFRFRNSNKYFLQILNLSKVLKRKRGQLFEN